MDYLSYVSNPSLTTILWILVLLIFITLHFINKKISIMAKLLCESITEERNTLKRIISLLEKTVDNLLPVRDRDDGHPAMSDLRAADEQSDIDERRQQTAEIRELLAPVRRLTTQHKQFVEYMVQIQQMRGTLRELTRSVLELKFRLGMGTEDSKVLQ